VALLDQLELSGRDADEVRRVGPVHEPVPDLFVPYYLVPHQVSVRDGDEALRDVDDQL